MDVQTLLDELMRWSLPAGTDEAIRKLDGLQANVDALIGQKLYDLPKEPNMRRERLIDLLEGLIEGASPSGAGADG